MPAAAGLTLSALLIGRGRRIEHDLHLLAPEQAVQGQPLPLRAQLYGELNQPEGPRLVAAVVAVELRSRSAVLARGRLRASYAGTLDGALRVPAGAALGRAELIARAELGDATVTVSRPIAIKSEVLQTPLAAREERPLQALQRFAAGPVRLERDAAGPPPLLVARVAGGACVPERTCRVFIHVGEPAAAVRAVATPSVTPLDRSAGPSPETAGTIALRVVTHGPEAELRITAERSGMKVASRAFRLPVALGASAPRELSPLLAAGAAPVPALQGDERGCIADAFHEQRWVASAGLADCRGYDRAPFAPLAPGLWRMQLRRDPFTVGTAGVATVYVRRRVESDAEALARIARAVLELEPDDALAQRVHAAPDAYTRELAETAGYLLAALDGDLFSLPQPISGYPRALAAQAATHARVRKYALVALALCALSIGLIVAQRGFAAAGVAGRVMEQAGEAERSVERQRLRINLRVLAAVSSLLLAFVAIAAYVIARAGTP